MIGCLSDLSVRDDVFYDGFWSGVSPGDVCKEGELIKFLQWNKDDLSMKNSLDTLQAHVNVKASHVFFPHFLSVQ